MGFGQPGREVSGERSQVRVGTGSEDLLDALVELVL